MVHGRAYALLCSIYGQSKTFYCNVVHNLICDKSAIFLCAPAAFCDRAVRGIRQLADAYLYRAELCFSGGFWILINI